MILNLLFTEPIFFLVWLLAIIFGITIHEFSHAAAAVALGDNTPKDDKRLTINPLAHIDLIGFLALLVAGFGWGKPVMYNPYNLKNQKWGPVWIALAGPGSNLLAVIVFGLLMRLSVTSLGLSPENLMVIFLVALVYINVVLMVFNLVPIPPLDGSKVLFAVLPDRFAEFKIKLQRYGSMILLGLILFDSLLNVGLFSALFSFVLGVVDKLFG